MNVIHNDYENLIYLENLLRAWRKFKAGKEKKIDVMEFERHLENNLFSLYQELRNKTYRHSGYEYFRISDPKKRDIYKAGVKDKIVHQALYDYLRQIYEPLFIEDSYSSRIGKGTHKAIKKLEKFANEITENNFGQCYALKCDIKKFFANIDHNILLNILEEEIKDESMLWLLGKIIKSFNNGLGKGIPLGNITSQIFANIYLNKLDYFIKNNLKLKYYVRYNDDFIILSGKRGFLFKNAEKIKEFIRCYLSLGIPDNKIIFRKLDWGIDFCDYIVLPNAMLLRQKTKKKMIKNIAEAAGKYQKEIISSSDFSRVMNSYFGLLKHCNSYNLRSKIKNKFVYGKIV